MSKQPSPQMPTTKQIKDAFTVARELCPGVRIKGVGPDGVIFEYPDQSAPSNEWLGRDFSGNVK